MRLFACPRRPRRMKLCRERTALTICGTTVSSYPTMPGKIGLPSRSRDIRFSRSSSLTRRDPSCCALKGPWRNSPRVRAKLMVGTPKGNDLKRIIPPASAASCPLEPLKFERRCPPLHQPSVPTRFSRAPQAGEDGFEIADHCLQALCLRQSCKQALLEVEVE